MALSLDLGHWLEHVPTSDSHSSDIPLIYRQLQNLLQAYQSFGPGMWEQQRTDAQNQMDLERMLMPQQVALGAERTGQETQARLALEQMLGPQVEQARRESMLRSMQTLQEVSPALRQAVTDPQAEAIRAALGAQIEQELGAGAGLDAGLRREVEQGIRSGQQARGMTQGNAPVAAEAFARGQAGQRLRSQRQQAAAQFLRTQEQTGFDPLRSFAQMNGQQVGPRITGSGDGGGGGGGFQGSMAGGFNQWAGQIGGMMAQNRMLVSNEDALAQQNRLAGQQGILGGAAAGASTGATFGWPGALIGGVIGAGAGYAGSRG